MSVARQGSRALDLRYLVKGNIGDIALPLKVAPQRANELWRRTCFEAFVRAGSAERYYEFNFSPSHEWAAYRFDAYRSGMKPGSDMPPPQQEAETSDDAYELRVLLNLDLLTELPADESWRVGLSAVIEETSGEKFYFALAHPKGAPDFHHKDCFAMEIPAA